MREKFDEREKNVVRQLADRFHSGNKSVRKQDIDLPKGCDEKWFKEFVRKLQNYDLITWQTNISFVVNKSITEALHNIDNPELPNHWKRLIDWWFSKRWTLPITAIAVGLPLAIQWIEMAQQLLKWLVSGSDVR